MSKKTKKVIAKAAKAIEQCYQDNNLEIQVFFRGDPEGVTYQLPSDYTRQDFSDFMKEAAETGWLNFITEDIGEEVYINVDNVDSIQI